MTSYALPPAPAGVDEFGWASAIAAVRGYCGWHIAPLVAETLQVDGPGTGVLLLPTLHLRGVTSVTDDGVPVPDFDKLQWSERGGIRHPCRNWGTSWRGITVAITHGYDNFPGDVLAVARDMAKAVDRIGASALTSGPHQVQFGATGAGVQAGAVGMSDLQRMVLDRYRLPGRP